MTWKETRYLGYGPSREAVKKRLGEGVGLHEASGWRGYRLEGDVIHMGARLYHYPTGRFLQADPLGHASDMSLYSYANNDPVNAIDPTGRHSSGLTSGISGFNSTQMGNSMQNTISVISGGINTNRGGWETNNSILIFGSQVLSKLSDVTLAHDRNWQNFTQSAVAQIQEVRNQYGMGANIEWSVQRSTYEQRAINDGHARDYYASQIERTASQNNVNLRWYNSDYDLAININTTTSGGNRTGNSQISETYYFGHGKAGEMMLQYNDSSNSSRLTDNEIRGMINGGAFTDNSTFINYGCNGATCHENDSVVDAWGDVSGGSATGVRGTTSYHGVPSGNPVIPNKGASWFPFEP
ncbi:MAG: RHS repeat-associated core domain-containing protein [Methylacidiphilales bacterium]|nr:RHS repeat-associated core domain-containing protein [Candidatus Methylacidiphilales bacterium]